MASNQYFMLIFNVNPFTLKRMNVSVSDKVSAVDKSSLTVYL